MILSKFLFTYRLINICGNSVHILSSENSCGCLPANSFVLMWSHILHLQFRWTPWSRQCWMPWSWIEWTLSNCWLRMEWTCSTSSLSLAWRSFIILWVSSSASVLCVTWITTERLIQKGYYTALDRKVFVNVAQFLLFTPLECDGTWLLSKALLKVPDCVSVSKNLKSWRSNESWIVLFQRLGPPNTLHLLVRDVKKVSSVTLVWFTLAMWINRKSKHSMGPSRHLKLDGSC